MAEFSPQIMDQFRDFQRKKRQNAIGKARQIVGGTAETLRTGRSAAATFADRAPQHDVMSRKEKIAASAPFIKDLGQEEQFYAGEARKHQEATYSQFMQTQREVIKAEIAAQNQMYQSQRTAAQLGLRERLAFAGKQQEDLDSLITGDSQTQAMVKSAAQAAKEEVKSIRSHHVDQAARALASSPGWDELSVGDKKREATAAAEASQVYQTDVQGVANRYAEGLLAKERPPGQAVAGLELFSGQVEGLDLNEMAANNPDIAAMVAEREQLITDKQGEIVETWQEANEVTRRTHANNPGVTTAVDAAMATAEEYKSGRGPAPGGPVEGQPSEQGAEGINQYNQVLGLPVTPATDSKRRTLQLLELIEEYPEHPPLIEARNQLLNSAEFKKYQSDRGYTDPGIAFKVMKKEMRMKIKDDKRDTREQVREDLTSGRLNRAPRTPPTPPKAPVQGSAGRQAEVDSGGTD